MAENHHRWTAWCWLPSLNMAGVSRHHYRVAIADQKIPVARIHPTGHASCPDRWQWPWLYNHWSSLALGSLYAVAQQLHVFLQIGPKPQSNPWDLVIHAAPNSTMNHETKLLGGLRTIWATSTDESEDNLLITNKRSRRLRSRSPSTSFTINHHLQSLTLCHNDH